MRIKPTFEGEIRTEGLPCNYLPGILSYLSLIESFFELLRNSVIKALLAFHLMKTVSQNKVHLN